MPDLNTASSTLQVLFELWGTYLTPGCTPKSPKDFYEQSLMPKFITAGLDAAVFVADKFPALHDLGIDLDPTQKIVPENFLPSVWDPSQVKQKMARNLLAQFLLAYIWKLGKFPEVSNVMAGYKSPTTQDAGSVDENAVVMRQFGRHLASPAVEPIFDQHTVRFFKIYTGMSPPASFVDLLASNVDQPCTMADRQGYVSWWKGTSLANRPTADQIWADRIMFSLGKAAKRLGKKLANAGNGGQSKKGKHPSQFALAQELVALNPRLAIAQMRPLLMEKLNISKSHADTYFYSAKRKLR